VLIVLHHEQDKWIAIYVRNVLFVRLGGMAYFKFKHIVFVDGEGGGMHRILEYDAYVNCNIFLGLH